MNKTIEKCMQHYEQVLEVLVRGEVKTDPLKWLTIIETSELNGKFLASDSKGMVWIVSRKNVQKARITIQAKVEE